VAPGAPASTMVRATALAALALVAVGCSGRGGGSSAQFGETRELGDRTEVTVRFESRGAKLVGTLTTPHGDGPHPALVWVHGSGPDTRTGIAPAFADLLDGRFAFFAYDKRGAGESAGECCPLDFDLLADDVLAAVDVLRSQDEIDDGKIGLLAFSEGTLVAPVAATKSDRVRFAVSLSGVAVSLGEVDAYGALTGAIEGCRSDSPLALVRRRVMETKPSRFDPRPVLVRVDIPILWLFGARDMSVPVFKDLPVLRRLRAAGKDFDTAVFPNAGHMLTRCETQSFVPGLRVRMNAWLREHVP
jgi:uncharacterized protein